MLGRTHELAAAGAITSAAILFPVENITTETAIVSFLMALVGGITPDLDKPGTKFWDNLPAGSILSRIVNPFVIGGHRHITHSLIGLAAFSALVYFLLSVLPMGDMVDIAIVTISFAVAFASHIATDMLTKGGVPLFYPLPFHVGFPPVEALRLHTNGLVEKLLVTPAIILGVIILGYLYKENLIIWLKAFGLR